MREKNLNSPYQEYEGKFVLTDTEVSSIQKAIKRANEKGWKKINLQGSDELCRAAWVEAQKVGIESLGYVPTAKDLADLRNIESKLSVKTVRTLTGDDIAENYYMSVIPYLEKELDELKKKRTKLGVTRTDMDMTYGLNIPEGQGRLVDEAFFRTKERLGYFNDEFVFFKKVGSRSVTVEEMIEDGVTRYEINARDREVLTRQLEGGLYRKR